MHLKYNILEYSIIYNKYILKIINIININYIILKVKIRIIKLNI